MMKRAWTAPVAVVEQFAANEYVAACYKIKCNVPSGTGFYDYNNNDKIDEGEKIASGSGCGTWHIGVEQDDEPVANAKWRDMWTGKVYPVFHFYAEVHGAKSDHFCTLDSVNWETNPNAS